MTSFLNISLHRYNPATSSTFSALSCYDERCLTDKSNCLADNAHCRYGVEYGDHSQVYGYYVQELITYERNVGSSHTVTSTAPFIFGCGTVESGFSTLESADGILGLGPLDASFISQFAEQGLSPKIFSHCLSDDRNGSGVLILGEIAESDITYSPLIPSQPHYNLDLKAISVNGKKLPIDPHMLTSLAEHGVYIDSGTTLIYLQNGAFTQVISAINASTSALRMQSASNRQCYLVLTSTSLADVFPQVSLHFAGDADLVLDPRDYLMYEGVVDGGQMWCTGIAVSDYGTTIVGEVVMKNRLFVYDLVEQRIGWKTHNCSTPVNISAHGRRFAAGRSMPLTLILCFLHILLHYIL